MLSNCVVDACCDSVHEHQRGSQTLNSPGPAVWLGQDSALWILFGGLADNLKSRLGSGKSCHMLLLIHRENALFGDYRFTVRQGWIFVLPLVLVQEKKSCRKNPQLFGGNRRVCAGRKTKFKLKHGICSMNWMIRKEESPPECHS